MNARFIYMKLLGFMTVIIGFSYSLTSLYNFLEILFKHKLVANGVNIFISLLGLLFPIFIFVFGLFLYFYADITEKKNSKFVNISIIINFLISIICIIISMFNYRNLFLEDLILLVHNSFGYLVLIINILCIYGKYKYIY